MRYLVCTVMASGLSKLLVTSNGDLVVKTPMEVWTLRTGKQILTVELKLHKLLARYHVGGSYESGAMYGLSYPEMCLILEDLLGPHDRSRCDTLIRQQGLNRGLQISLFGLICGRLLGTIAKILGKSLIMIVVLILLPIIIRFVSKPK